MASKRTLFWLQRALLATRQVWEVRLGYPQSALEGAEGAPLFAIVPHQIEVRDAVEPDSEHFLGLAIKHVARAANLKQAMVEGDVVALTIKGTCESKAASAGCAEQR